MKNPQNPRFALLTIGNEITSGQILNRNSSWLADELGNLGLHVDAHLSVEDHSHPIQKALDYLSQDHDALILTGGLGPTRDDLTRNAVSQWMSQPLEFDENSWKSITDRLNQYGIPVSESNKQQCYFPSGAKIYNNRMGTANAFRAESNGTRIYCLPGPPREIQGLWDDHLHAEFMSLVDPSERLHLFRFHCLGKSESALGEIVEQHITDSTLLSGYRPHIPYVEVKLWSKASELAKNQTFLDTLRQELSPWLVAENDDDLALRLLQILVDFNDIQIFDQGSQGILAERLGGIFRRSDHLSGKVEFNLFNHWDQQSYGESWVSRTLELSEPESLTLVVGNLHDSGEWAVGFAHNGFMQTSTEQLPYRPNQRETRDRFKRFLTEATIKYWIRKIEEHVQKKQHETSS